MTETTFVIRPGRSDDAAGVDQLVRDALGDALDSAGLSSAEETENALTLSMGRQRFEKALNSGSAMAWVALDDETPDGKVAGYIVATAGARSRTAQINWMAVSPEFHGSGLADKLIDTALDWIGPKPVELTVVEYNHRAIAFYEQHGFIPARVLREFEVTRILMRRDGGVRNEQISVE